MRHLRSILVIMVVFCLGSIDGDSHQTENNQRGSPTAMAIRLESAPIDFLGSTVVPEETLSARPCSSIIKVPIGIAEFMSLSLAKAIFVFKY